MDPQQRLLLEVHVGGAGKRGTCRRPAWWVLRTGVFIGLCNSDYFHRLMRRGNEAIDAYLASGNAPSVAAGRISYALGLRGPSLVVDTSCSSSLVAVHLACRSLRSGETRVALAGAANVICAPETMIALSKARMLAPDGPMQDVRRKCRRLFAREGCGVVVLKRLGDAVADGDNILAVIRGTAINQDGRSGGLTVPEWAGARGRHPCRSARCRRERGRDRLCGGAWHRNVTRRSDRGFARSAPHCVRGGCGTLHC